MASINERAVLSIGMTHPWNIAGLGLDISIGTEFGVRVLCAVAAVSVQGARGLEALQPMTSYLLDAQLQAIPTELIGAIRVGALATAGNTSVVAAYLRANSQLPAVVDPVFRTSLGGAVADNASISLLRDELATAPNVVLTPNLAEAACLLDVERVERDEMADAAESLHARGARAVLLKGGHLAGDPRDVLADASGVQIFSDPRLPGELRGSGCTLAMALACELARGRELSDAVSSARALVRAKIARHAQFGGFTVAN